MPELPLLSFFMNTHTNQSFDCFLIFRIEELLLINFLSTLFICPVVQYCGIEYAHSATTQTRLILLEASLFEFPL